MEITNRITEIVEKFGTYTKLKQFYEKTAKPFFNNGLYNLNFLLVRDVEMNTAFPNRYNDYLVVGYKTRITPEGGVSIFKVTSVPGTHWLVNPMNPTGAGAIAPGYYRSLWKLGRFRDTDALIQIGQVRAYRDNDKDKIYEFDEKSICAWGAEAGFFLHQSFAGKDPNEVNKSSAGCIVPQLFGDYEYIINLVKEQKKHIGSDIVSLYLIHL